MGGGGSAHAAMGGSGGDWIQSKWYDLGLATDPAWLRPISFAIVVTLASLAGGLVSGYPAPTEKEISDYFDLTVFMFSVFATLATIGSVFGVPLGVCSAHFFGRKIAIGLGLLMCMSGWLWVIFSKTTAMVCCARTLTGVGAGFFVYPVPAYLIEISPEYGTHLVGFNQVGSTIGIVLAYAIGPLVGWRYLALIGAILSLLFLCLLVFIPETDVWLYGARGRNGEEHQEHRRSNFLVGVAILTLQQLSGINGVLFYSTKIFKTMGMKNSSRATILMGMCQVVFTIVGVAFYKEKWEKTMLLLSSGVMTVSLGMVALAFGLKLPNWICVSGLVTFVAAFSAGMSFIPWIVALQVFSDEWKNVGIGVASCFRLAISSVVTLFIGKVLQWGKPATFGILASVCAFTVVFVALAIKQPGQ